MLISFGPQLNLSGDMDHRNVQQDWVCASGFSDGTMARSTLPFNTGHGEIFERFNNTNFPAHGFEMSSAATLQYFKSVSDI